MQLSRTMDKSVETLVRVDRLDISNLAGNSFLRKYIGSAEQLLAALRILLDHKNIRLLQQLVQNEIRMLRDRGRAKEG